MTSCMVFVLFLKSIQILKLLTFSFSYKFDFEVQRFEMKVAGILKCNEFTSLVTTPTLRYNFIHNISFTHFSLLSIKGGNFLFVAHLIIIKSVYKLCV